MNAALPTSNPSPQVCCRKRKGMGHERRDEILCVAKRLFVELGYEQTTIRRVAAELGLSSTALYVYFPDKKAILDEICRQTFSELTLSCEEIARCRANPVANLRRAVGHYLRFGLEHPHQYLLTFNQLFRSVLEADEADDAQDDPGRRAFESFRSLVEDVAAAETGTTHGVDTLAQCLWAGMHGLVSLLLVKPCFPWTDRDELIEKHVTVLCEGILRAASAKAQA